MLSLAAHPVERANPGICGTVQSLLCLTGSVPVSKYSQYSHIRWIKDVRDILPAPVQQAYHQSYPLVRSSHLISLVFVLIEYKKAKILENSSRKIKQTQLFMALLLFLTDGLDQCL